MYLRSAQFSDVPGIVHGFFTRNGGVSEGIFASLNCGGRGTAEPADIVDENRRRVAEQLGLEPHRLISVHQVHGPDVAIVDEPWDGEHRPRADAMVTKVPGIGLGILTADCAPVLFADADGAIVGAAHAGWKGAFGGVLEATVDAMVGLGARAERISACVGPALSQASYQIDADFHARFLAADAANARYFTKLDESGHAHFNLPVYVRSRLAKIGLATIAVLPHDTYREESAFFSYRRSVHRQEADYGRQISVIAIAQNTI